MRMWRKYLIVTSLVGAMLSVSTAPVSAFAGGSGTVGDPYRIATCAQLFMIDDSTSNLSKHYAFTSNIDCSGGAESPMPASGSTYFSGSINGGNFSVTGLDITCTSGWACALFLAATGNASFSNITFASPIIDSTGVLASGNPANARTAVLVGYSGSSDNPSFQNITIDGGTIDAGVAKSSQTYSAGSVGGAIYRGTAANVSSSATVTGSGFVGGLFGVLGDQNTTCSGGSPSLTNSSFTGSVTGAKYVGGLVGEFGPNRGKDLCSISNSFNTGTVTGAAGGTLTCSIIGGIVGQLWEATVESSYNTGAVSGATSSCEDVGGVVGWARGNSLTNAAFESPTIEQVYSTGAISGTTRIGGVAGTCDRGDFSLSYSTGSVSGGSGYTGGLVGWNSCLTVNTYSRSSVTSSGTYMGGLAGGISYYGVSKSYSTAASRGSVGSVSNSFPSSCTGVFWDKTVGAATSTNCGPTGKTTAEMKTESTFTAASWDFTAGTGVWSIDSSINNGYPYLANVGGQALAAPTVVLARSSATSSSTSLTFTLTATSGQIDCGTVSTTDGVDFDFTNISSISVAQTSSTVCTISATSTVTAGSSGTSSLAEASSFAVSYTGSATQANISSGSPSSITVTIAAPTTSTSSTTSTSTSTSSTTTTSTTTTTSPASSRSATTTTLASSTQATSGVSTTTTLLGQSAVATIAPRSGQSTTTTSVAIDDEGSISTTSTLPPVPIATTPPQATAQQLTPIDVPSIDRGGAAVVIGGQEVPVEITRENDQVLIRAGMFDARFAGLRSDGSIIPLDSDGFIRVESGDAIRVEVLGFASNSDVEVRLYSDPMLLGKATVDDEGKMLSAYEIPEGVDKGAHRVVLVGKNQRDDEVTFTAGIIVGAEVGTSWGTRLIIAVPIGLAVLLGIFLPAILRRRREEEEAVA